VTVVLDASAAMEIADGRAAASGLKTVLEESEVVMAPDLFVAEVVNSVWKCHQFEEWPLDRCERVMKTALWLVEVLVPSKELYAQAFLLARTTRRAAYDMFYLALARREDATLLTRDVQLRREALRQGLQAV
jgi:predicted nucleic acid-binding protein